MEIDNLTTLLSNESGRATLKERIQLISYSWNTLKTLILNKGEKVYNLKIDYTGLDSILSHFKEVLAGSADIPYSKLFNSSGGGSALSGSSAGSGSMDRSAERQWSDYVNAKQTNDWLPGIEKLVRIWLSDLGFNFAGYPYKIEFPSILQLTESEEAGLEKTKAETAKIKSETT
jgi:hypothetical protein